MTVSVPADWPAMRFTLAFVLISGIASADEPAKPKSPFDKWEKSIAAFEAADAKDAPPQGGILFVGSSSIRLWDVAKSFPDRVVINRGFGGSQIADSVHFADRIILKHKPRIVVLYAGDNDINAKKTPKRVADDFRRFVETIHKELPNTRIGFIAIKPSIKRWSLVEKMRKANALIAEQCKSNEKLTYLDIDAPMLGADGKPRPELFAKDGLHLNETGYEVWAKVVREYLRTQDSKAK